MTKIYVAIAAGALAIAAANPAFAATRSSSARVLSETQTGQQFQARQAFAANPVAYGYGTNVQEDHANLYGSVDRW